MFRSGDRVVDGWALNASRSGVRAILEESVALGAEFQVEIGEAPARPGRVVWLQEEKDGAIVGVHYLDEQGRSGSIPDIQALTPPPRSVRQGSIPDLQTLAPPHAPPVRVGPPIAGPPASAVAGSSAPPRAGSERDERKGGGGGGGGSDPASG